MILALYDILIGTSLKHSGRCALKTDWSIASLRKSFIHQNRIEEEKTKLMEAITKPILVLTKQIIVTHFTFLHFQVYPTANIKAPSPLQFAVFTHVKVKRHIKLLKRVKIIILKS